MSGATLKINTGMAVAMGLLAVGAALMFLDGNVDAPEGLLQNVGFGIVIVSTVLYLGSRIVMLFGGTRRGGDPG